MVRAECVCDSLICCSHIARVVFIWPMLIRMWSMTTTGANMSYTNTHTQSEVIQELLWSGQCSRTDSCEWKCLPSSPPLRQFNPKLTLWKSCRWLLHCWALCAAVWTKSHWTQRPHASSAAKGMGRATWDSDTAKQQRDSARLSRQPSWLTVMAQRRKVWQMECDKNTFWTQQCKDRIEPSQCKEKKEVTKPKTCC